MEFYFRLHHAGNLMLLSGLSLLIQWLPSSVFGVWLFSFGDVPILLLQYAVIFFNLGGLLNAGIYIIKCWQRRPTNLHVEPVEERRIPTPQVVPIMRSEGPRLELAVRSEDPRLELAVRSEDPTLLRGAISREPLRPHPQRIQYLETHF